LEKKPSGMKLHNQRTFKKIKTRLQQTHDKKYGKVRSSDDQSMHKKPTAVQ